MTARFSGRRAIVTGGASGIGRAVAGRLTEEGAQVAIWDRDAAGATAAAAEIGGIAVGLDIADWQAVERAAAETAEKLGGIDILVASAGITGPNATLIDYPVDAWKQVFDVNVHGLFHCNKAVAAVMKVNWLRVSSPRKRLT